MFLRTESGPVGWRKILLAIACVIGGAAVSLSRTVGAGSLNTIWIEDAKNLLTQALNSPFRVDIRTPISGYYQVPARIITEIACMDVTAEGLVLREVAPGVSARDVQERTEPTLKVASDLGTMTT